MARALLSLTQCHPPPRQLHPPVQLLALDIVPSRENRRPGCILRWCKLAIAGSKSLRSLKNDRTRSITGGGSVASSSTASCSYSSSAAPRCAFGDNTRQGKARQGKARQGKAGQERTRQDRIRQHKTRRDKTRQDKTRQDKTRQDKTRQDKTRQDKT